MTAYGRYSAVSPSSRPLIHSTIPAWLKELFRRAPSSQTVLAGVKECRFCALLPMPLLPEVQNGTMVFPEKSYDSKKVERMRGACPHQMG